jgi:hypothetical protein
MGSLFDHAARPLEESDEIIAIERGRRGEDVEDGERAAMLRVHGIGHRPGQLEPDLRRLGPLLLPERSQADGRHHRQRQYGRNRHLQQTRAKRRAPG